MQNSPEDLCILQSILVPPTCIRPASVVRNTKTEQDLTRNLVDILKHNASVKASPAVKNIEKLQQAVNIYFDKDVSSGRKRRAVGALKQRESVADRFAGGKKGRIRQNNMGRRVNNCSRFVVGPDALLDLNKLRIPQYVAMENTREEVVNQYNIADLRQRIRIGTSGPGGAHYVVMNDGSRANLKNLTAAATERILQRLEYGCTVRPALSIDLSSPPRPSPFTYFVCPRIGPSNAQVGRYRAFQSTADLVEEQYLGNGSCGGRKGGQE